MNELQLTSQIHTFQLISVICLILFLLFLAVDISLFITMRIWETMEYLSGRSEKRFVKKYHHQKELPRKE